MTRLPIESKPSNRRRSSRPPSSGSPTAVPRSLTLLAPGEDTFPRSETMRFLMGGKGKMVTLGLFTGLLLVKPKLAVGLVRFLPLGKLLPIGRILQIPAVNARA